MSIGQFWQSARWMARDEMEVSPWMSWERDPASGGAYGPSGPAVDSAQSLSSPWT